MGTRCMFQQDTNPKHTGRTIQKGLSQSSDLNPIEYLWIILKLQVHQWNLLSHGELRMIWQKKWAQIEQQCCKNLITSCCRCLDAVIAKNSVATLHLLQARNIQTIINDLFTIIFVKTICSYTFAQLIIGGHQKCHITCGCKRFLSETTEYVRFQ